MPSPSFSAAPGEAVRVWDQQIRNTVVDQVDLCVNFARCPRRTGSTVMTPRQWDWGHTNLKPAHVSGFLSCHMDASPTRSQLREQILRGMSRRIETSFQHTEITEGFYSPE